MQPDNLEVEQYASREREVKFKGNSIDGWDTQPSSVFEGLIEIVKSRKDHDSLTIHFDIRSGRVRKFAGEALYNPRIEKEHQMWLTALKVFKVDHEVSMGRIRRLKGDPSHGYEEILFLDMPYMGLPIDHYAKITSKKISSETINLFTDRMVKLVREHGIFFPDMNEGNVLVYIKDGDEVLFPIDWEAAQTRRVRKNPEYYVRETLKRCSSLLERVSNE